MHKIYDVRHYAPLRVEPECPLDERTEWIVGRSTESVLMYSADSWTHGLMDSRTRGLTDSWTRTGNNYIAGILVLCRRTACVSPRVCETYGFADSRTQNILGRIGGLLSILSYIQCLYIHLLIYVRLAIAVP